MAVTIILHIIAVVCIILGTYYSVSLWRDLSPKHKAALKGKVIGGAICSVATLTLALTFVWAMFIA